MKKNVMMRVAALLLVCVLASTCGISGTFAKYVTNGTSTDFARVAKFGVVVTGSNDMFNKWYTTHDTSLTSAEQGIVGANSVVTSNGDNLLAPGTNGSLANFTITGTPEVAVRVTYELTSWTATGWEVDSDVYFPIIFTVNSVDYYIGDSETVAEFMTRVQNAIAASTEVYAAGTNLATAYSTDLSVSWRWNFEGGSWAYQSDYKDTVLGNAGAATFTMTITAIVEQID